MDKKQYHHGNLRKDLIDKGLQLINKEGYEGLSLRKVAVMCGVSHAAPYKHFENKDELVYAITLEAINSFTASLEEAVEACPNDPTAQLIEMGKQYVKFMVENPDYFKFIFLCENSNSIKITNNRFSNTQEGPFDVFQKCANNYLNAIKANDDDRVSDTVAMWSLVHGFAALIVNKSIVYEGNYLNLIEEMIINKMNISGH